MTRTCSPISYKFDLSHGFPDPLRSANPRRPSQLISALTVAHAGQNPITLLLRQKQLDVRSHNNAG